MSLRYSWLILAIFVGLSLQMAVDKTALQPVAALRPQIVHHPSAPHHPFVTPALLTVSPSQAHAFVLSLVMILLSELGDKTFFIAAILAMKHPRGVIFFGGASALVVMSVLSAAMGHLLPHIINRRWVGIMAGLLFLVFGAKMLLDGWSMSPQESEELEQVEQELSEKKQGSLDIKMETGGIESEKGFFREGFKNLLEFLFAPGFIQAFVLVFLAEWGDRSQIATIALAAAQDMYFVTLGTIVGHCMCTGIAVVGGRMLAQRISVKTGNFLVLMLVVTLTGALMFICFAFVYLSEAVLIESW